MHRYINLIIYYACINDMKFGTGCLLPSWGKSGVWPEHATISAASRSMWVCQAWSIFVFGDVHWRKYDFAYITVSLHTSAEVNGLLKNIITGSRAEKWLNLSPNSPAFQYVRWKKEGYKIYH